MEWLSGSGETLPIIAQFRLNVIELKSALRFGGRFIMQTLPNESSPV